MNTSFKVPYKILHENLSGFRLGTSPRFWLKFPKSLFWLNRIFRKSRHEIKEGKLKDLSLRHEYAQCVNAKIYNKILSYEIKEDNIILWLEYKRVYFIN